MQDGELPDGTAELLEKTRDRHREREEKIAEFHEAVQSESSTDVLETTAQIAGDITVDVSARQNGELIDRIGEIERQLQSVGDNGGVHKVSDAADEAAQLLADLVDDAELTKDEFYTVYRREGFEMLMTMFERISDAIESEAERRRGAADGFRPE